MGVKGFHFLPVAARELQVASRRRETILSRFLAGFLAIAISGWLLYGMNKNHAPSEEMGQFLFYVHVGLVFLFTLIFGVRATCDSLCREKREGTLGFLFLTNLKSYDIVFGKVAVASMKVIYAILAIVPIMAIPLLLGGVAFGEFSREVLVILNFLFLSLAVGIFVSSFCESDTKSASIATLIQILLAGAMPLTGFLVLAKANFPSRMPIVDYLASCSSVYGCFTAIDDNYRTARISFWVNAAGVHLAAWFFLFLSCRQISKVWHDKPNNLRKGFKFWLRNIFQQSREVRESQRPVLLAENPYLWRCLGVQFKKCWVWGLALILPLLCVFYINWETNTETKMITGLCVMFLGHLVLKNWLASTAASNFSIDRRSGVMELILTTPIRPKQLIEGQLLALLRSFAIPIAVMIGIDCILMFSSLRSPSEEDADFARWTLITMVTFLLLDLFTLAWVGMWHGLKSKSVNRAVTLCLIQVMVIPSVLPIVLGPLISSVFNSISPDSLLKILWWGIGIAADALFLIMAQRKLKAYFMDTIQRPNP